MNDNLNQDRPQVFFDLKGGRNSEIDDRDAGINSKDTEIDGRDSDNTGDDGKSFNEKPDWDEESGYKPKKRSRFASVLIVGIVIGVAVTLLGTVIYNIVTVAKFKTQISGNTKTQYSSYDEKLTSILAYLDAYYIGEVDKDMVADGLSKGLLSGINDKYAQYYTEEEFNDLLESTSGLYSGIGVSVVMNDNNQVEVYKVFEGTPADFAGIQARDVIIEADGKRDFADLDSLVAVVRGKEGTTIDITVKRGDEERSFTVERKKVSTPTIEYEMLKGNIGYIYISEFDTVTVEQFSAAVDDLEAKGMRAIIIDVRDNPGGDYDSVVAISDRVLPKGKIISTKDKNGNEKVEYSDEEHKITVPIVILVNRNTASAAELFSGAVQDYGIGVIVGEQTYGKGVVQSIFRLNDGSGMKFTTEQYFIPSGVCIDGVGLTPDVEVAIPDEAYEDGLITEEEDTQLQKALEILK